MQAPFLQALKHRRELPGRPRSLDPLVRGVFREMQLANRVGVHGPVSRRTIETTRIHLGNVSQHDRRDASFLSYMSVQTLENNPIAEMRQRIALHCELPDGGGRRGRRFLDSIHSTGVLSAWGCVQMLDRAVCRFRLRTERIRVLRFNLASLNDGSSIDQKTQDTQSEFASR